MTRSSREPAPGGDRDEAFSQFYRGAFSRYVGKCILMGVPAADAPGIVQELMAEIYRRWAMIESPAAYADFAVPRRAAGFLKVASWCQPKDEADLAGLGRPLTASAPDGVLRVDEEELVLEALAQLSPRQRAVFALTFDDYTCADIAKILELPENTVRSHLRHARTSLRTWWAGRIRREEVDSYGAR